MSVLIATEVVFFSQGDEKVFFDWLKSIQCIREVRGVGRDLQIEVEDRELADSELRELIAVFHRYAIGSKQLAMFATERNSGWFRNKKGYWYLGVFG